MEQFQINESCLVRAPAFHARPAEETSPSLPASFFLGEQKQRPKPERGYNFKLLTRPSVGAGGEEGVTSQFSVLLSKRRMRSLKHRVLSPLRLPGDQRSGKG